MNARKHSPQFGISGFPMQAWASGMELAAAANAALAAFTAGPMARPAPRTMAGAVESPEVAQVSPLVASAVEEGSNLEMDWLWLATKVTAGNERRYCLLRALAINPASEIAWRELQRL